VLFLIDSAAAYGATGPLQTPVRVTSLYTDGPYSNIVVSFGDNSLPGCYGNSTAVLLTSNVRFKELYAQLLMLIAMGGVKGYVNYTQNTPTGNWSDCFLNGLYLTPD
jgi:hypothetical protein